MTRKQCIEFGRILVVNLNLNPIDLDKLSAFDESIKYLTDNALSYKNYSDYYFYLVTRSAVYLCVESQRALYHWKMFNRYYKLFSKTR